MNRKDFENIICLSDGSMFRETNIMNVIRSSRVNAYDVFLVLRVGSTIRLSKGVYGVDMNLRAYEMINDTVRNKVKDVRFYLDDMGVSRFEDGSETPAWLNMQCWWWLKQTERRELFWYAFLNLEADNFEFVDCHSEDRLEGYKDIQNWRLE
jgi:hypothetical protein